MNRCVGKLDDSGMPTPSTPSVINLVPYFIFPFSKVGNYRNFRFSEITHFGWTATGFHLKHTKITMIIHSDLRVFGLVSVYCIPILDEIPEGGAVEASPVLHQGREDEGRCRWGGGDQRVTSRYSV